MCAKVKEESILMEGVVTKVFPGAQFEVLLTGTAVMPQSTSGAVKSQDDFSVLVGRKVLAYVSGRMRVNYVKILVGDRVTVEFGPYSMSMGRITFRHKIDNSSTQS